MELVMADRRRVCIGMLLIGTTVFTASCNGNDTRRRIRLAYINASADLPIFVAKERGIFERHALDVELIRANDSSEALTVLLTGGADAVGGLTFGVFFPAEIQDPDKFRLFQPFAETEASTMSFLLARRGAGIRTLKDLRGRSIGTYTGASQLVYLKLFLERIGLNPTSDVAISQVGLELQAQALAAGQFDALFTVEPYGTIAKHVANAEVLIANPRSKYIAQPFWVGASAVSTSFIEQSPELVTQLRIALDEAAKIIGETPAASKDILPRYTPISAEYARESGLYTWYAKGDSVDFAGIQQLADLMAAHGLIRQPLARADALFLKP